MIKKKIYLQEIKDWNKNADFYAVEAKSLFKKILREEIKRKFKIGSRHKKILDIGAGAGDLSSFLYKKDREIVCLDFADKMREVALTLNPCLDYHLKSAHRLPFEDESFDMVIAGGVLHHLKTQGILNVSLKEIHRVLKRGGYFCYLDRSNSFLAGHFEFCLSIMKSFLTVIKKNYAASSTTAEVILETKDFDKIRKGYKLISRSSIYCLPFKFLMVLSHFFFYTLGENYYLGFQKLTWFFAFVFEKYLNFQLWETEKCEVLVKE